MNNGYWFSEIPNVFCDEGQIHLPRGFTIMIENVIYHKKLLLWDIMNEECTRTVQRVCDIEFDRTKIFVFLSTVGLFLKQFHYTLKMVSVIQELVYEPYKII
ncbi:hypothetical protein RF11_07438 [Thelohanellus kitauei]|uniref:Uncharacterized protein n=1 Tax=Thelohanellus kitauei TaxID=669202 RepID=A0A0C2MQ26_THEKT|nr:hypothetical protein RF11_07438 [Thelohanellus kitauei]